MTLTQKETMLLKDLMKKEQLCIDKYGKGAQEAHDNQLKDLFTQCGNEEKQHLDTLTQISNGTVPPMNNQGGGNQKQPQAFQPTYSTQDNSPEKQKDKYLCTDTLETEKHASSVYNTSIFEFKDANIRDTLNHIQKEEQEHGEKIYCYMEKNGMYS